MVSFLFKKLPVDIIYPFPRLTNQFLFRFVIPAGYLGGAFWGAVFVAFSGDRWASLAIAILFCVGMVVSLKFAPNATMIALNIGFIVLTVTFILIDSLVISPFLQFLTLFCKWHYLLNVMFYTTVCTTHAYLRLVVFSSRRCFHWNL